VAPQAASSGVTVAGMAQWLCVLESRWQGKAPGMDALSHDERIDERLSAWNYVTPNHAILLIYVILIRQISPYSTLEH
jgi:hypothetical protein